MRTQPRCFPVVTRVTLGVAAIVASLLLAGCASSNPPTPPQFGITTTSGQLVNGTVNSVYPGATLTAANGTAPYTWTMTPNPVDGLSLSAAGTVSGTPTQSGTFTTTVTVTDSTGKTATASLSFSVAPTLTSVTVTSPVTAGNTTNGTVTVSGPAPAAGAVINLQSSNTTLATVPASVTVAAAASTAPFMVTTGSGGSGGQVTITATYGTQPSQTATLAVNHAPTLTSANSTNFTVGAAGTFTVTASGTPAASLAETGPLPSGVTFTASTGVLAGTPAVGTAGSYPITITAQNGISPNATQTFTLTVDQAPAITSSNGATFTTGTLGTFTATATGFPAATFSETGALPGGVTLSAAGLLSGTPAANTGGSYAITITAQNGIAPNATQTFTLTVDQVPGFTSQNNTTFTTGTAGTFTAAATGYPAPTFSETGALPTGVTLNANGTLSGTPAASTGGSYAITITAQNGIAPNATQTFTLTVDQAPAITSSNGATFTTGTLGTFTATATGYPAPTFSETGALPAGVTLNANGALSGTPGAGAGGTYPISITAQNGTTPNATQTFTLTVDSGPAFTSSSSTTFTVLNPGTFTVAATGFPSPTYSETGALPTGVTLTSAGILSGTPGSGTQGSYPISITAQNGIGTNATQAFTLTVGLAPTFTSSNNTTFTAGTAGTFTATATGFPVPTFSETGALPSGVTLTSAGLLSGTPAAGTGGTYSISVTAQNGITPNATQSFTLTVDAGPAFTSSNGATFTVLTPGTFTVTATGFPAPTFSETGALPTGVTLTSAGTLSGMSGAGTGGTYAITITAQNGISPTATQAFILTVDQAPAITSGNGATFAAGTAGTFTATATGFPAPTFSETGALPSGVTLTTAGILSGAPAANAGGTYSITVTAQNGVGVNATQTFTLTVDQAPSFTSQNNTTFAIGSLGTFPVTAAGFPTPTFSETGALPSGVTLTSAGLLSGTPAAATQGPYPITVTAQNGVAPNATQTFTLTVSNNAPPSFTSSNGTTFTVGASGSFTVMASGTPAPTFSETGALPSGVTLTSAGLLSGTPAAGAGGTYSITITAQNGITPNATQTFTLTADQAPAFTSQNNTTFTAGTAGTFTAAASGFPAPTFSETGALPSGVTLTSTGILSGAPGAGTGGTYSISVTAQNGTTPNATQAFTLTVDSSPAFTNSSNTTFTVGTAGTFTVAASGFPAPTFTETGPLPSGVTLNSNGTLSGTPAANTGGAYPITITAHNNVGTNPTQAFTLTVDQVPGFTSQNNTTFTTGTAGTFTAAATGYPAPTFSETGALPTGVTLNANGTLSGTPAASTGGSYAITITAQNGIAPNATQTFTLTVDQAPAITSSNGATFTTGTLGTFTATATGYPAPTFSETGALPAGVTLNANGALSGTPGAGAGGTYPISITAQNGTTPNATQTFTLTVDSGPAFTSSSSTTFTVLNPGTFTVAATGFPSPTYSETGALPTGVTLTSAGILSGTPGSGTQGSYPISITAQNGIGTNATQAFTLTVGLAPTFTSSNNTTFTAGTAGTFTATATGFPVPTFSETGALPSGVTLTSAGLLSGTPAAGTGGTYSISVTAQNGITPNATQSFTLTVDAGPAFTSSNGATFTVLTPGTFTVTATGFPAPTFSETGALPTGVTLTSAGILSGTPASGTQGSYSITVTAQNGVGTNPTQAFTLTVASAPCSPNCMISGTVSGPSGSVDPWLQYVNVQISGTNGTAVQTAANGTYSLSGLTEGAAYTVTPSLQGYTFSPTSATISSLTANTAENFTISPVVTSYSISGTISYPGSKTGETLINVYSTNCNNGCSVAGTTLAAAPTAGGTLYTIRGLSPGTYLVNAEVDTQGTGTYNASNPEGAYTPNSGIVTIASLDQTNINFALADRAAPSGSALQPPNVQGVVPSNDSALIFYQPSQNSLGEELATSYKIYYGTDSSNLTSVATIAAGSSQDVYILSGLTNTDLYYFQMSAVNSSGESAKAPATPVGPITIGAASGGNTVSGTVTFTGITPKGPLTVGLYGSNNNVFFESIPLLSLSGSQASFTITGAPAGNYQLFAVLDQNNDNTIAAGDITNFVGANGPPTISVPASAQTIALTAANAVTFVTTNHSLSGSTNSYNINVGLNPGAELPVSMTLFSGPNAGVPFDIAATSNNNQYQPVSNNSISPNPGDIYQFLMTFEDGSTQVFSSSVSAVLSVPTGLTTQTTSPGSTVAPLLKWTAPSPAPSFYTYNVNLNGSNTNENWQDPGNNSGSGLPSTETSVVFGSEGSTPSPSSALSPGGTYNWSVQVKDANGNSGQNNATYTVAGIAPPTVTTSFNPSAADVSGQVTLNFNIQNPDVSTALTGIGFSDTLTGGLTVASLGSNSCGGTPSGVTSGSTSLSLAGASLSANSFCNFSINVTAPSSPATISNATGVVSSTQATGAASNTATLSVLGTPSVSLLSSSSGTAGSSLTITGANFGSTQSQVSGSVTVNGAAGPVTSWSSGSITVTVPSGASGTGFVVVTVLGVQTTPSGASFFTVTSPATSIQSILINPYVVVGGTSQGGTVTLNGPAPSGGATVTFTSSNTSAASVQSVTVPSGSSSASFTVNTLVTTAPAQTKITATFNGTNTSEQMWINPPGIPYLTGMKVSPSAVNSGASPLLTVTLSGPAPSGGAVVAVQSDSSLATFGSSATATTFTVAPGATTGTLSFAASSVTGSPVSVSLTGDYNGPAGTSLTIYPAAAPVVASVTLSSNAATGGTTNPTATVTLTAATLSGATVILSSNSSFATVPASISIGPGVTTSAPFTVTTTAPSTQQSATISASYGGGSAQANLIVTPASTPVLASITTNGKLVGGIPTVVGATTVTITGTVTIGGPAPSGGALVTLSSNDTSAAQVPANVIILANNTSATFAVTTSATSITAGQTLVTLSGSYGGVTQTSSLAVDPPLAVKAANLPVAALGIAYLTTAIGHTTGIGPFTYQLVSGTPPTGLSLTLINGGNGAGSLAGQITGTTSSSATVGNNSFTVTVTDGETPPQVSAPVTLTIPVVNPASACGSASDPRGVLNGGYAALLQGWGTISGTPYPVAEVFRFTANGNGTVGSAGTMDINTGSSIYPHQQLSILSGTYSIASDNSGCLQLNVAGDFGSSSVSTIVYHFAVTELNGPNSNNAMIGRIIQFDNYAGTGPNTAGTGFDVTGVMHYQDLANINNNTTAGMASRFAYGADGEVLSSGSFVHFSNVGSFNLNTSTGAISNLYFDTDYSGTVNQATGGTGQVTSNVVGATTGRGTFSVTSGSNTYTDVFYVINPNEYYSMEIDSASGGFPLAAGRGIVTSSYGSYSASGEAGNYMIDLTGLDNGTPDVLEGIVSIASDASVTANLNEEESGFYATEGTDPGQTVSVDPNSGRTTIIGGGNGGGSPILYPAVPVLTGTDRTEPISVFLGGSSGDSEAMFGFARLQPSMTYSDSNLPSPFISSLEEIAQDTNVMVGRGTFSSGTSSSLRDTSGPGGLGINVPTPVATTFTVNSDGTVNGSFNGSSQDVGATNGTDLLDLTETGIPAALRVWEQ